MTKQKLFEYAVLYHPKPTKEQKENDETPKSVILVDLKSVLATDDKEVGIMAAREIPPDYTSRLDSVEILIRPL